MRKSRFSEEQMVVILREGDRGTFAEVARKHKVSAQTLYGWGKKFGEMEPTDIKRLRELEAENAKLYDVLRSAAAHARTLPNRVADAFCRETVGLPRSTEAERVVVQRLGQNYFGLRCSTTGRAGAA